MGITCSHPHQEPLDDGCPTFGQKYSVGMALGAGEVGIVYECFDKDTWRRAAVKFIERRGLSRAEEEAVYREVAFLRELKHRHILKLHDFFADRKRFYLVAELCSGGELTNRITYKRKRRQPYTEKEARDVVRSLLLALYYCHSRRIVHRDVKPENILLANEHDNGNVRLADFGLSQRLPYGGWLNEVCGTACYMAPEMLGGGPYGTAVDLWGAGCVTFILLGGYHPFFCHDSPSMFARIRAGAYEMRAKVFDAVSDEAKDLVRRLLEVDPSRRLTAIKALQHPWVCARDETLVVRSLDATLQDVIQRGARRRLRSAIFAVIIMQRMWRQKQQQQQQQAAGGAEAEAEADVANGLQKPDPSEATHDGDHDTDTKDEAGVCREGQGQGGGEHEHAKAPAPCLVNPNSPLEEPSTR